jgi:hypothetical protein
MSAFAGFETVALILKAMGWTPPLLNGIYVPNWSCYQPVNKKKESTMNKLNRVGIDTESGHLLNTKQNTTGNIDIET